MILLIDNYDSFTYNLYQYLCELGAEVEVARNDKITLEEIERMAPEKIVISPGPCTPAEAGISNDVLRRFGAETPTLGVCLGQPVRRIRLRRDGRRRGRDNARQDVPSSTTPARASSPDCPTRSRR